MYVLAQVRRSRSAPLAAFVATALLAIVLAAQAQLACSHAMVVAMPGMEMHDMPGMTMPPAGAGSSAIALCPIVLVLGIAAALLCANAVMLLVRDPHRGVAGSALARRCARLPLAPTAGGVLALGSIAVGSMMAIDGSVPAGPCGWLQLIAIVASVAVGASILAVGAARCALALTRRIALAVATAIGALARAAAAPSIDRSENVAVAAHRAPLLAARRGLRAPPLPAR